MHELGIAESALEQTLAQARRAGASRVERIVLRVGALSGVDPEALRFALEAIMPGSAVEGAALQIDTIPAVAVCPACRLEFVPDNGILFECPSCGWPGTTLKQGRELDLARLELT